MLPLVWNKQEKVQEQNNIIKQYKIKHKIEMDKNIYDFYLNSPFFSVFRFLSKLNSMPVLTIRKRNRNL